MSAVVGPILARPGGYAFDIWTVVDGVRRGYAYRRIEDARYARNAAIEDAMVEDAEPGGLKPLAEVSVCSTLDQFISELVERGALVTDKALHALYALHVA
jgi:hypothetical protein